MPSLLPAELAWYVTGRFYQAEPDGPVADYGYFLHLPFLDVPLFDGPRGETTAHFTFAAKPFQAKGVDNGALKLGVDPVGEFSIYLQRRPEGTFDDPASFARGDCIATFRRASLVVGTTVTQPDGTTAVSLVGTNVFSARLVASRPSTSPAAATTSPSISAGASPSSAPPRARRSRRRRRASRRWCPSPARPSRWAGRWRIPAPWRACSGTSRPAPACWPPGPWPAASRPG